MSNDIARTANLTIRADSGTTGNTNATGNRSIFANLHVMGNLYLIIQNNAVADDRVIQGASIDRSVGTYMHSITYDYSAHLMNWFPAVIKCKPKTL